MVGGLRYRGGLIYPLTYLDCLLRLSQDIASVSTLLFSPDARLETPCSILTLTEEIDEANVAFTTINPSSRSRCTPYSHA